MNSSSLGMMMISVLRFSALPETLMFVVLGLYSLRPPAVILDGSTPNCVCSILATAVALNADQSQLSFGRLDEFNGTLSVFPSINTEYLS